MNDDVLPTFDANDVTLETVLSDNDRPFCSPPYELLLQLEHIAHPTARAKRAHSNGIVDRLHRAIRRALPTECRRWLETVDDMKTISTTT